MAKRRHNPDQKNTDTYTSTLPLWVLGGLAAVYFLVKSQNTKHAGLIGDGTGTGTGTPAPPDKTTLYGADAIRSYQQFVRQVYIALRDSYFSRAPEFFATIGISDPGPADGVWNLATENASRGFLALGQRGLDYMKLSPAAMAAQGRGSADRLPANDLPFHLMVQFATLSTQPDGEAFIVERLKKMRDDGIYISHGDFWALYGGTGFLNIPPATPWPFDSISSIASSPGPG